MDARYKIFKIQYLTHITNSDIYLDHASRSYNLNLINLIPCVHTMIPIYIFTLINWSKKSYLLKLFCTKLNNGKVLKKWIQTFRKGRLAKCLETGNTGKTLERYLLHCCKIVVTLGVAR